MNSNKNLQLGRRSWAVVISSLALALLLAVPSWAESERGEQKNLQSGNKAGNRDSSESDGGCAPVPEASLWISMGTLAALTAMFVVGQKRKQDTADRH
jgi:hypothetical protein